MVWASVTAATHAGRPAVVKATAYDARLEADGLKALAEAGAPTPAVYEVDEHRLVMERADGPPDWEGLGRSLAVCHRATADAFGYRVDNVLGPLRQLNQPHPTWSRFYLSRRLEPFFGDLPHVLSRRIRVAADSGRLADLLDHGQAPALVHGDLWAGNVISGRWLIDPAVNYADRELDLAFAAVFGGIPDEMWHGYEEVWPLDDGWQDRRPGLQLYHLVAHVRIFGAGYLGMVADRLDRLGW